MWADPCNIKLTNFMTLFFIAFIFFKIKNTAEGKRLSLFRTNKIEKVTSSLIYLTKSSLLKKK